MIVTERERGRGRDIGRGRSRLHAPGARRGIRSRVSRIAPWAKSRRQTAAPPRDPENVYLWLKYDAEDAAIVIMCACVYIYIQRKKLYTKKKIRKGGGRGCGWLGDGHWGGHLMGWALGAILYVGKSNSNKNIQSKNNKINKIKQRSHRNLKCTA